MKKISRRSIAALILSIAMVCGLVLFLYSYVRQGATWASFASNQHVYTGGVLSSQRILDRSGTVLYQTKNGEPDYNKNQNVREATLHAVGDISGNISTSAMRVFTDRLIGYDLLNGVYHMGGNGRDLYLTIDSDVCVAAMKALNGRSGTVGVYNYKTGEILCMVSTPTFDPENPPDFTGEDANNGAYINRFLSASFVPGSVFKLVTAAAAIDNIPDIFDRTFTCKGSITIDGGKVTCPKKHGTVDFKEALAESCNVAFAQISNELGADVLEAYAKKAGFNSGVTVDGVHTAKGKFDLSGASKLDIAWSGIGQYTDLLNPCTYLTYIGAIANGGAPVYPQFLYKITSESGQETASYTKSTGDRILSADTAATLAEMMRYNVTSNYGAKKFPGLELCAKTGTAEVGGDKKPNAWFAGFLRNKEFPLAFVVLVENGGSGVDVAGPIANKVLQAAIKSMK